MRSNEMRTEALKGRHVLDKAGNDLGDVEDVVIDPAGLRVTGFILRVNREAADRLRLNTPVLGNARIELGAERIASIGDSLLLNIDQREMASFLYNNERS